MTQSALL